LILPYILRSGVSAFRRTFAGASQKVHTTSWMLGCCYSIQLCVSCSKWRRADSKFGLINNACWKHSIACG